MPPVASLYLSKYVLMYFLTASLSNLSTSKPVASGDAGWFCLPVSEYPNLMIFQLPGGAVPVSYTHLDVYKRQIWSSKIEFLCRMNKSL